MLRCLQCKQQQTASDREATIRGSGLQNFRVIDTDRYQVPAHLLDISEASEHSSIPTHTSSPMLAPSLLLALGLLASTATSAANAAPAAVAQPGPRDISSGGRRLRLAPRDAGLPLLTLRTAAPTVEHGPVNIHAAWNVAAAWDEFGSDDDDSDEAAAAVQLEVAYADCAVPVRGGRAGAHHVGRTVVDLRGGAGRLPERFVWIVEDSAPSGHCLSAWLDEELVATSAPLTVVANPRHLARRDASQRSVELSDFDATGLWFDGVAALKCKNDSDSFVAQSKDKKIAIVGAGAAGLMTSLLLDSVGLHNYTLIEAGQRYGGRIHTVYFGDRKDRLWQEAGPMRFPFNVTIGNETVAIQDHRLVFQLIDKLNEINTGNSNLTVNYITWIQSMEGDLLYKDGIKVDGRAPNRKQIAEDPSLYPTVSGPPYSNVSDLIDELTDTDAMRKEAATNVFRAHHDAIKQGLDDRSQFGFIHNLWGFDLNVTDYEVGAGGGSFWDDIYDSNVYFSASYWRTIDDGLNRIPEAFWGTPVANKTVMGRRIVKVEHTDDDKTRLSWKLNDTDSILDVVSEDFDYAFIAVPFSIVRFWSLPKLPSLMTRAISDLGYGQACKTMLKFKTRFWEHFDTPILGGCSSSDVEGMGSTCYPSYDLNSTGPGIMLASYTSGDDAVRLASWEEKRHVQFVLDNVADMHGNITYDQYTGEYFRKCWILDDLESGSWAEPSIGQHKLFIPEYYKIHSKNIFIGEHTSFT
ncbi:hypothetical protein HK405_008658, partial [Cladochytrium tenue]